MRTATSKWRQRVLEACQVVARSVSPTDSGAAHTVQRMMQDATFRSETLDNALAWAGPGGSHYQSTEQYQRLQAAVDVLRGYEGVRL